jgi:hypothetical protein
MACPSQPPCRFDTKVESQIQHSEKTADSVNPENALAALDEAISVSPLEHLQKRIAVLEQKVGAGSEPPRNQMESKPGQSV